MQKITPFLLFDGNAEEAMKFYTSVFKSSKIVSVRRFPGPVPGDKGQIITGTIQILGQEFMVLQGGPRVPHSMAISFFVNCENQAEVDYLWEKLSEGGQKSQCGWTTSGRSCRRAARRASAGGSPTSSASGGRSFPRSWAGSWETRPRKRRAGSCRRCSR